MDIQLGLLAQRLSNSAYRWKLLGGQKASGRRGLRSCLRGEATQKGHPAPPGNPFRFIFWKGKTNRAVLSWSKQTSPGSWFSKIGLLQELNKSTGASVLHHWSLFLIPNLTGMVDRYRLSQYDGCNSSYLHPLCCSVKRLQSNLRR